MGRFIKHSELPIGEPFPLQLRARSWKVHDSDKGYGRTWMIQASLPRTNPLHDGEYEHEYVTFKTQDEKLVKAIEGALVDAPSRTARDGVVYEISIVREKDGKKNRWKILPGWPQLNGGAAASPPSDGAIADSAEPARMKQLSTDELRHRFVLLYRTIAGDLGLDDMEPGEQRILRPAIVNAVSRLLSAQIWTGR